MAEPAPADAGPGAGLRRLAGAGSSVVFVVLNCAMNIYMKWLFSPDGGDFALPWTMLAVQQAQAYLVLQPWLAWRDATGRFGWGLRTNSFLLPQDQPVAHEHSVDRDDALGAVELLQVLAVTGLFCLNVGLNSLSLVHISITLNQTVRACLPVGVLLFASCVEQQTYPSHSYITTGVLVLGVIFTCWGSPDFDLTGFSLALTSTFVAAVGTSLNGRLLSSGPFKGSGADKIMRLMMLQSVPAFFFFGCIAAVTEGEQVLQLLMSDGDSSVSSRPWPTLLGLISISSALALVSNLSRCFLVASTSALMETFAGNAKVATLCLIDNRFFGTILYSYNYLGIIMTFLGFSANVLMQYITAPKLEERRKERVSIDDKTTDDFGKSDDELRFPSKRRPGPHISLVISGGETGLAAEHLAIHMRSEGPRRRRRRRVRQGTEADFGSSRPRSNTWAPGQEPSREREGWLGKLGVDLNPVLEAPAWLQREDSFTSEVSEGEPLNMSRSLATIPESPVDHNVADTMSSRTPLTVTTSDVSRNRFFTDVV